MRSLASFLCLCLLIFPGILPANTLTAPTLPSNSLFHSAPASTANYYLETDPRFTQYKQWLSPRRAEKRSVIRRWCCTQVFGVVIQSMS